MRYAIVKFNIVVNIIIADRQLLPDWIQIDDTVQIGDNYNNGVFSRPT